MNTNKRVLWALLAGGLLICPTAAWTQEGGMEEAAPIEEAMSISGTVASVDLEGKQIVVSYEVDGEAASAVFKFSDAVMIMKGEEAVMASDLKEEDSVTVDYSVDGDMMTANIITVEVPMEVTEPITE